MKDIERQWRELARRQHGIVSRAQLEAIGLTGKQVEGRTAAGVLDRVHRGFYRLAGSADTFEQRAMVACLAADGVASHRCAAALWQLRRCEPGPVEVTVANRRAVRLPGVVGHRSDRLRPVDVTVLRSIPVTSPARTLLDLGAVAPPHVVESATEDAIRRKLVSHDWLDRTVRRAAGPGRNGSGVLREVLGSRAPGDAPTDSDLEDDLLRLLRRSGVPLPVRQHCIRVQGRPPVYLDLSYPDARLAIEAQSLTWHMGRERLQRDCDKANLLVALGWRLLLFTWWDVHRRPRSVVAAVTGALSGLGAT